MKTKVFLLLIIANLYILSGKLNLHITLEIVEVDDCISRVHFLGNNANLYSKDISNPNINCNHDYQITDKVIVDSVPYEIEKKIVAVLHDRGGGAGNKAAMSITVYLNEYIIKPESQLFWKCDGCSGRYEISSIRGLRDYFEINLPDDLPNDFDFIFEISSLPYLFDLYKKKNLWYRKISLSFIKAKIFF